MAYRVEPLSPKGQLARSNSTRKRTATRERKRCTTTLRSRRTGTAFWTYRGAPIIRTGWLAASKQERSCTGRRRHPPPAKPRVIAPLAPFGPRPLSAVRQTRQSAATTSDRRCPHAAVERHRPHRDQIPCRSRI